MKHITFYLIFFIIAIIISILSLVNYQSIQHDFERCKLAGYDDLVIIGMGPMAQADKCVTYTKEERIAREKPVQ